MALVARLVTDEAELRRLHAAAERSALLKCSTEDPHHPPLHRLLHYGDAEHWRVVAVYDEEGRPREFVCVLAATGESRWLCVVKDDERLSESHAAYVAEVVRLCGTNFGVIRNERLRDSFRGIADIRVSDELVEWVG